MRLRNVFVLGAFVLSFGMMSCSKKTEEQKPADSMMTPAPAAPAPAPTPAPAPMPDTNMKKGSEMKSNEMKKEEKKEMKKK